MAILKKHEKKGGGYQGFFLKKKKFEQRILSEVDDIALKKSFEDLNAKLENLNIDGVGLSFIDSGAPFSSAFLVQDLEELDLSITSLGSGIEMIVSLLFLETLASLSRERIVVLIDEPELHLHPSLQEKFAKYLQSFSQEKQVFVSTHSPYFFKPCLDNNQIKQEQIEPDQFKLMVTKRGSDNLVIIGDDDSLNLFPWSPSWGEINYSAYDLLTVEFHNELYGYLQEREDAYSIKGIESYFSEFGEIPRRKWIKKVGDNQHPEEDVTLMTFIRHSIHHPENNLNELWTPEELRTSIQEMIKLIQKSEPPH